MMLNQIVLRTAPSINVIYRSDGNFVAFVHTKLHPISGVEHSERWRPTANRYDVLLPKFAADELQRPEELLHSFTWNTVERQNALALHMKFFHVDPLPVHGLWETVRAFAIEQFVNERQLPCIMVAHNPLERGFVDAANQHIHLVVLARERLLSSWGRTTPLVFNREWETLETLWTTGTSGTVDERGD